MKKPQSSASHGAKYIYVIFTRTNGTVPALIRAFSGSYYNHASISFDAGLHGMYSFARLHLHSPLVGGPVREYLCRYTLRTDKPVDTAVFALKVSPDGYNRALNRTHDIFKDDEYVYNLFSVVSHPVTGGFPTYKAYSCSEFVSVILKLSGIRLRLVPSQSTPNKLFELLRAERGDELVYLGDIRGCVRPPRGRPCRSDGFFAHDEHTVSLSTFSFFGKLVKRQLGGTSRRSK